MSAGAIVAALLVGVGAVLGAVLISRVAATPNPPTYVDAPDTEHDPSFTHSSACGYGFESLTCTCGASARAEAARAAIAHLDFD